MGGRFAYWPEKDRYKYLLLETESTLFTFCYYCLCFSSLWLLIWSVFFNILKGLPLPSGLFGYWLLNDDEMFDNQVLSTTHKVNMTDHYGKPLAYKYLTPVPTLSGRWAVLTAGTFYTRVRKKENYIILALAKELIAIICFLHHCSFLF